MDLGAIALKLERGGIYALEHDQNISEQQMQTMKEACREIYDSMGIRFIILPKGMSLARFHSAEVAA